MTKKATSSPSPTLIEITVLSAENLTSKKQPVKKNAFITVRTGPSTSRSTRPVDPEGGGRPLTWNERMAMEVPAHARHVTVEAFSGGRAVGSANIPVADFASGLLPENYLSFLSYRLRDGYGEKNGIVNLSVKVVGGGGGDRGCAAGCSRPWMAAPAAEGKVVGGGVAMGIPVFSYK